MAAVSLYGDLDNLLRQYPAGSTPGTAVHINFKELLHIVKTLCNTSVLTTAELYGANRSRNHPAWREAEAAGCMTYSYVCDTTRHEKQIDATMTINIARLVLSTALLSPQTTGRIMIAMLAVDNSLLPAIVLALQNSIGVVVFAFDSFVSTEFRTLESLYPGFRVVSLNSFATLFGRQINVNRAESKEVAINMASSALNRDEVCTVLHCLKCGFCVRDEVGPDGVPYLLVEVAGLTPEDAAREIRRLIPSSDATVYASDDFGCSRLATADPQPCLPASAPPPPSTSPSEASTPPSTPLSTPPYTPPGIRPQKSPSARNSPKNGFKLRANSQSTRCRYGRFCDKRKDCQWQHTETEHEFFNRHRNVQIRHWKSRRCNKLDDPNHTSSVQDCSFSHGHENGDVEWCAICRKDVHVTDECPFKEY